MCVGGGDGVVCGGERWETGGGGGGQQGEGEVPFHEAGDV